MGRASYRGGVQEKRSISDGTQKREPTWEAAHDKSGIGVQAGGRFWRGNRRGCAPTGNIDLWGFEDIDQTFVQLVPFLMFALCGRARNKPQANLAGWRRRRIQFNSTLLMS